MAEFDGFPKEFFGFFRELKANNERAWFEANKTRFRETVQAPMSAFIAAMAPHLARVSKQFLADPASARRLDVPHPSRRALLQGQTSV